MSNPFEVINNRLTNIEELLLSIKHPPKSENPVPSENRKNVTAEYFCSTLRYMAQNTFYQRAPRGDVPGAFKIGARWFVDVEEFEAKSKKMMVF